MLLQLSPKLCEEWVQHLSCQYKLTGCDPPPFPRKGKSHGAVLWMEYYLAADISVSTGLVQISNEKVILQSNLLCQSP